MQVPLLQERIIELMDRNQLLERLREDLSVRLAKQQDSMNVLRAASDKLFALAGATAAECAAAQQTCRDAEFAALQHLSQVRALRFLLSAQCVMSARGWLLKIMQLRMCMVEFDCDRSHRCVLRRPFFW
jgi:hypothetical protein